MNKIQDLDALIQAYSGRKEAEVDAFLANDPGHPYMRPDRPVPKPFFAGLPGKGLIAAGVLLALFIGILSFAQIPFRRRPEKQHIVLLRTPLGLKRVVMYRPPSRTSPGTPVSSGSE